MNGDVVSMRAGTEEPDALEWLRGEWPGRWSEYVPGKGVSWIALFGLWRDGGFAAWGGGGVW